MIRRGAEAEIFETDFFGKEAVIKRRVPKGYRIEELDRKIRAERTRAEARAIHRAKEAGVRTPYIYDIDMIETEITMERLELPRVKDVLDEMPAEEKERVAAEIGKVVARLHSSSIIHGDLTTSNMLMEGKSIALIDFGLAEITKERERMASDLRVLKEGWRSAHYRDEGLIDTILNAYERSWEGGKEVLKILDKAESRRRYVKKE